MFYWDTLPSGGIWLKTQTYFQCLCWCVFLSAGFYFVHTERPSSLKSHVVTIAQALQCCCTSQAQANVFPLLTACPQLKDVGISRQSDESMQYIEWHKSGKRGRKISRLKKVQGCLKCTCCTGVCWRRNWIIQQYLFITRECWCWVTADIDRLSSCGGPQKASSKMWCADSAELLNSDFFLKCSYLFSMPRVRWEHWLETCPHRQFETTASSLLAWHWGFEQQLAISVFSVSLMHLCVKSILFKYMAN